MLFFESNTLLLSILIILACVTTFYHFSNQHNKRKKFLTFISISSVDFLDILPTISILVIVALILTQTRIGLIFSIIFLGYITYYNTYKVTITLGNKKFTWPYYIHVYFRDLVKWSFNFFFNTFPLSYVWSRICDGAESVLSLIKTSKHDILVGLFIINPTKGDYDEMWDEQYNLQKKMFKYKKPVHPRDMYKNLTPEELKRLHKNIKANRTPSDALNSVKRLPWVFEYTVEVNELKNFILQNLIVLYNFVKTTIIGLILSLVYFVYTIFFFKIQFLKQLSIWFVIVMMYFWLMSGFNFFLKRYQYGKFTSAIQRFWKRTNTYFWLIEGFLILIFFYYYLNSSQEPIYMYDYSALNQEYLVSLHVAGTNIILLSLIIYFMYFTILRINSNSWSQLNLYLIIISVFVFFSFFIETYQFYYVVSTFNERFWTFNEEENLWSIDVDNPILRTKHQYLLVCLIAKYWHFLFIFLSWVFFLIKSFERRKITYVLFGANLQNMIILYLLNFACYVQWFKWLYKRFADLPYTWFMTSIDTKLMFRLLSEVKLLIFNLVTFNFQVTRFNSIIYRSLSLWTVDSLAIWKFV